MTSEETDRVLFENAENHGAMKSSVGIWQAGTGIAIK